MCKNERWYVQRRSLWRLKRIQQKRNAGTLTVVLSNRTLRDPNQTQTQPKASSNHT